MLVQTYDMNVVFLGDSYNVIDVVLVYAEFAFRTTCYHVMGRPCTYFGVYSNENAFATEFLLKMFES